MKIIGHRGARGLAPENTLEAIEAGIKAGADEIEVDVRVTSDGIPILHHDSYVCDYSSGHKRALLIDEHTLGELRAHKPDLPTLQDAIETVELRTPMILEVKPKVSIHEVVDVLQQFLQKSWRPTDFLLASFSQRTLRALHKALPDVPLIVNESFLGLRASRRARELDTTRINMNQRYLWWGFVRSMHRAGFQLCAYTLNNPQKAARWARHGLYGVITDYPKRFTKQ